MPLRLRTSLPLSLLLVWRLVTSMEVLELVVLQLWSATLSQC